MTTKTTKTLPKSTPNELYKRLVDLSTRADIWDHASITKHTPTEVDDLEKAYTDELKQYQHIINMPFQKNTIYANLLQRAACYNAYLLVKVLLENGANNAAVNTRGETALHIAIYQFRTEIAELLIDHRANIDNTNNKGETALHYAAELGDIPSTELLIKRGANINIRDNAGRTPIDVSRCGSFSGNNGRQHHGKVTALLKRTMEIDANKSSRSSIDLYCAYLKFADEGEF